MITQGTPIEPAQGNVKRRTGLRPICYGRLLIDIYSHGTPAAPVLPDTGPARMAVLTYRGRIVKVDRVLECLEHAHARDMIGATVRCVGSQMPCAVVEAWSWSQLREIAQRIDEWTTPGIQGFETVREKAVN